MARCGDKWVNFMFMGEYRHTVDEKGRLTIPSKLRYDLGELFVVTRGLDGCLSIYPKEEWTQIITKYRQLPNTKDARNFMRFLLSGALESELDKQGRVNLNLPLMEYAGLEKECVIIGVSDHIEIWSSHRWEEFMTVNQDQFSDLADHLFAPTFPS